MSLTKNGDFMIKIYGKNCTYEAIFANHKLECVYTTQETTKKDPNFTRLLEDKKIKYQIIDKKKMDSMFPQSQGYGAIASDYQYVTLEDSLKKKQEGRELYLVLDGLEDPHNFGAILRSADAFGVKGVIIPKNRSVSVTEVVAHVSTGAIEYVDIIMVNNLNQALTKLKDAGYWIVGTDASGDKKASDLPKDLNLAVIIGSEGFGMSRLVKKSCDINVVLPMEGHVNSLNASVAASVLLYQVYNSRHPL